MHTHNDNDNDNDERTTHNASVPHRLSGGLASQSKSQRHAETRMPSACPGHNGTPTLWAVHLSVGLGPL